MTRDRESVLGPGEEEPLSWPPATGAAAELGDATAVAAPGGGGQPDIAAAADESRTAIAPRPTLARIHNGKICFLTFVLNSVADPGSGAFLTPGSGMGSKSRSGSGIRMRDEHYG